MEENKQVPLSEELLSENQVFDVLEFTKALYDRDRFGYNFYTSDLANRELIDLNNDGKVPTYQAIEKALKEYKYNAEILQDYSEFMKVWDSIYSNTMRYFSNMLSFDLSMNCTNIRDPKTEYSSKEYLEDKNRVYKFFNKFKYKKEFMNVINNMLVTDTCFVWLRDSQGSYSDEAISLDNEDGYEIKRNQKFALQLMPQKYCKITGVFPDGFLWDFDLNYFNTPNVNIDNYDPSLRKALNQKKASGDMKSFVLDNTGLSTKNKLGSNGWVRTSVKDGAYCFKFDTSNYNTLPPFANMMKAVFNNDTVAKLQMDKDIASAYALLVGEMKTLKTTNSNQKDPFMINPQTLGRLLGLVSSGLKKNIKPIALPLEETKMYQFTDNNKDMTPNQYKNSSNGGASANSLIYSNEKMGQFELEQAIITDYNFIKKIYAQFESFLNFYVNRKTKKYKFEFHLSGSNYPFERKYRIDNLYKLLDKGLTLNSSAIASTFGYGMQEFESMLEEAHYGNLTEITTMLMNANTMSNSDLQQGRPQTDTTELKEGGQIAREYS